MIDQFRYNNYSSMIYKKDSYQGKIIVVGDGGVGKSSIIFSSLQQQFKLEMPVTVGAQFKYKRMKSSNNIPVKLKLIDTAGQQRYKSITSQYYKGSHGALIVFSLDQIQSFKNVKHWLRQIKLNSGDSVYKIILANKCDLQERKVSIQQIKAFEQQTGVQCIEVSAKTKHNIEKVMTKLTDKLVQIYQLQQQPRDQELNKSVLLEDRKKKVKQTNKCC